MDISNKKSITKTTPGQFRTLGQRWTKIATSRPIFGKSKADIEDKWDIVAKRINAFGPPIRNTSDWKRIWSDMKCRTKLKISENAKEMKGTGGGPSVYNALTDLEKDIDRICRLSTAAAPSGLSFGRKTTTPIVLQVTPPRCSKNVAVVSPSSLNSTTQFVPLESPTLPSTDFPSTSQVTPIPTADKPQFQKTFSRPNKKRKLSENNEEESIEVKLLRLQVEQNNSLVAEIKAQTKSIESMADSLRGIHQVMNELLAHLRDD